jgi:exonuclease SbcD
MRFLHMADIHLGCRRYNLEERTKDFFRAWNDCIVNYAIPNEVDFVLIAGDFFDRRNIDPQAMNHAIAGLQLLKDAGIPVIAIEGNHDQRDAVSDFSWMRSLSQWGYLMLLEPTRDPDGLLALAPWDEEDRSGSYVDVGRARIFGSHWYGASANAAIPLLSDAMRRAAGDGRFNILMLHTDVEGQINRPIPALTIARLKELKGLTHYVALGHTHKKFEVDNWAFNPGALEPTSIDEYKDERGVFLVEVDDQFSITATHLTDYVRRPFQRISFDVSGSTDADIVLEGILQTIDREVHSFDPDGGTPAPIVEITLRGQLGFKNSLLPISRIRDEALKRTGALHVIIRNQSVPVEYAVAAGMDAQAPRHERERRIIEDLIMRDNRFKDRAREMAELVVESKRLALTNETPDKILEFIEQKIQSANGGGAVPSPDDPDITRTAAGLGAIERSAKES